MKWDGSLLTSNQWKLKDEREKGGKIFWNISGRKEERRLSWCLVKKVTNPAFACLIDELKPVFGLEKIGTHWCVHEKKKYLLMHFTGEDNFFYPEEMDEEEEREMRRILLFRYVFHLSHPRCDNLVQREDHIISIQETRQSSSKFFFTLTMYEKYFHQVSPAETLREWLGIQEEKETVLVLCRFVKEIEAVIRRIFGEKANEYKFLSKGFYDRAGKRCRRTR